MNDETINTIDAPPKRPTSRWRWLRRLLLLAVAGIFLLRIAASYSPANPLDLELTRRGLFREEDGHALEIVNVGTKPVTITAIEVNDRSDCSIEAAGALLNPSSISLLPADLKIGDKLTIGTSCQIVRVTVKSSDTSQIFSFNR